MLTVVVKGSDDESNHIPLTPRKFRRSAWAGHFMGKLIIDGLGAIRIGITNPVESNWLRTYDPIIV